MSSLAFRFPFIDWLSLGDGRNILQFFHTSSSYYNMERKRVYNFINKGNDNGRETDARKMEKHLKEGLTCRKLWRKA
ncbi:hypothetical protein B4135_1401 [Caldibacillus debilis]|uniref:Uncharacterized protein n=1 Tax=Caldibacillus debilis TaxID=301148 RepID=A0A150MCV9_9BACI|nr:hypothetical protein B4135_1401 [Caldibacillus debilis]